MAYRTSPSPPSTPTAPTPSGGQPSSPTTTKDNSSVVCNRDKFCTGGEDCKTCSADCKTRQVTCGDGICVEGENCINCPSDCNGNISQNVTSSEKFCCGFADDYLPNGCSDSRCKTDKLQCFEEACEGKPNPSARSSKVNKNGPDMVIVLYLSFMSFFFFV